MSTSTRSVERARDFWGVAVVVGSQRSSSSVMKSAVAGSETPWGAGRGLGWGVDLGMDLGVGVDLGMDLGGVGKGSETPPWAGGGWRGSSSWASSGET